MHPGPKPARALLPTAALEWLGFGIAALLAVHEATGADIPACSHGSGCAEVLSSPYASAYGIPLSFWGMATYVALATLLALGFGLGHRGRLFRRAHGVAATAAALVSLALMYVQIVRIGAVCPWCTASAAILVAVALLSLPLAAASPADSPQERPCATVWLIGFAPVLASVWALLFVAQGGHVTDPVLLKLGERQLTESQWRWECRRELNRLQRQEYELRVRWAEAKASASPGTPVERLFAAPPPDHALVNADLPGAAVSGPATATLTVVQIADFYCPFCRLTTDYLSRLRTDLGDRVRVSVLHNPIREKGPSADAAEAAIAAACLGAGWSFWTAAVAHDDAAADAEQIAISVGLPPGKLAAEISTGRPRSLLRDHHNHIRELGLQGVPIFVVNGEVLLGALPYERLLEAATQALAEADSAGR